MKERIDVLLVQRGLAPSRQRAQALLMEGLVFVDGQREDKAGTKFREDVSITLKDKGNPFVSRGGLKLNKAMQVFDIDINDKVCIDIGASTGGFTDCMLQNGAKRVYSVDVGYGQLDYKLRNDKRVVCMEKTNIRYIDKELLDMTPEFGSVDVSFISLKLVLPVAKDIMTEDSSLVCLIKPQFEAGKDKVGKNGVVRDIETHREVIKEINQFVIDIGYSIRGLDFSPIKGPKGNIEYLIYISAKEGAESLSETEVFDLVTEVTKKAHEDM